MKTAEKALRHWLDALTLHAWEVRLVEVDAETVSDTGAMAQCKRNHAAMTCTITVATQHPREEIEAAVLHECLHLVTCEAAEWVDEVTAYLSREARELARSQFGNVEERIVRKLERTLTEEA